ncbi:dihydrofolate reductase [Methylobacterium oryzihabitans]|uniref:dihydrofolate reductase n=1 Tax=Methylobacterium oryzihabitans TaxID=2499852 RepID=A0A3S2VDE7_9HYPH|nr:dihydrofolate reductase [Methylobacterium oryzihabitans]RVU21886.1 hypothetical protein EOE48_02235 [Methylobacterium oryzihabitans]
MKPTRRHLPTIACIVARSHPDGVIGRDNALPWRLKTDLRFFRSVTMDHVVVMGRSTYASLGRPLPGRLNIVLSQSGGEDRGNLVWTSSRDMAVALADLVSVERNKRSVFVIGGARTYGLFEDLFTRIYLTEVEMRVAGGDAFFTRRFDPATWVEREARSYPRSEGDDAPFRIRVLDRREAPDREIDADADALAHRVGRPLPRLPEHLASITAEPDRPIPLPPVLA